MERACTGEPYTVQAQDIVEIGGYAYANADINGMNVMLREGGVYRLYFGDFNNPGGTFRATSTDGRHYAFDAKALTGPGFVNDVKKFRVGEASYYLMGLHENGAAFMADGFHQRRGVSRLADAADESRCRRRLYRRAGLGGARPAGIARAQVAWASCMAPGRSRASTTIASTRAGCRNGWSLWPTTGRAFRGPGRSAPTGSFWPFPTPKPVTGRFEVYAEDGVTLLGTSAAQAVSRGQCFRLR